MLNKFDPKERSCTEKEQEDELDQHDWASTIQQLLDLIKEHEAGFGPIKTEADAGMFLGRNYHLWRGPNFKQLHIDLVLRLTLGGTDIE